MWARYYTQARMAVACRKLYNSEPSILLHDQYEDKKVGLRMITFITEVQQLDDDGKVGLTPVLSFHTHVVPSCLLRACLLARMP